MNNMNNTIIRSRLTLYFGLYTPICYLFFAESTRSTRTNWPNVKTKKIKNPVSLRARWSGRHLRLSPLGADPLSPSPPSLFRSRTRESRVWPFRCQSDTFRLEVGHTNMHFRIYWRNHAVLVRTRKVRFVRRLGRLVYLADQHFNRRDYVANYGTITILSPSLRIYLSVRPLRWCDNTTNTSWKLHRARSPDRGKQCRSEISRHALAIGNLS